MKKLLLLAASLCLMFPALAQGKKLCITVDDLPTVSYQVPGDDFKLSLTHSLVNTFKENQVPAIGFVNEMKLYQGESLQGFQVKLLEIWLQNGLELGNHTFAHPSFHQVSFEEYTQSILKGEKNTKKLAQQYGSEYTYFRHPFLHIGLRQSQADSLRSFLAEHGYIESPVTLDNEDYLFALAYSRAYQKKDGDLMRTIGEDYVNYQEAKLLFFEAQSDKLFQRNIAQTLLLHANYLNAVYLQKLLDMYKKHGYTFVSQSEVLQDPAYQEKISRYGPWGISWLDRWALSRGKKGEFFRGDPVTPKYVHDLAK